MRKTSEKNGKKEKSGKEKKEKIEEVKGERYGIDCLGASQMWINLIVDPIIKDERF